jgi:hypothetical protein
VKLFPKQIKVISLLAFLVILPQLTGAEESQNIETTVYKKASWTDLTFTGSKFFSSINVKLQLGSGNLFSAASAKKTGTDLADCSETDNDSKLLTLKWSLKGLFIQGQYEVKIWFKTADGLPYKRIRFRNDDDPWVKSYCWEDEGVRRLRILPGSPAENKQPPTSWTDRTESFYEYPKEQTDCSSVMDAPLVFYILSTLDLSSEKNPYEICVFGKKQLHRLTIRQVKSSPIEVSYKIETSSQKKETIKDQITPLVYSIKTESLASEKDEPENFSMLGLHKDIRVYMDPEKQIPVRISGTNNSIGKLDLELRNAELN